MILRYTFWYLSCENCTPQKFQGLYPDSQLPWDGFPPPHPACHTKLQTLHCNQGLIYSFSQPNYLYKTGVHQWTIFLEYKTFSFNFTLLLGVFLLCFFINIVLKESGLRNQKTTVRQKRDREIASLLILVMPVILLPPKLQRRGLVF